MKHLLNILLLLAVTNIYSQNEIKGTVIDANTNKTLPLVNIYFPDIERGTTTNDTGHFNLNNLPNGNYDMVISFIGYKTQSLKIDIPSKLPLNISLSPSAIEMEDIIISTPFHKLQSENVMKVEQKSIAELKTSGAISLADGISNIAGVNSVSTGMGIGKPVIRGLSSNRVIVYTQGVRLENQQFGDEHGLGLNDAGVESVEVIKGPASLLYGSDALGGVLYLNPEKFAPMNSDAGDLNVNYFSNTLGYNANAGYKSSSDNFKLLFRASQTEHSDYKTKDYRATNSRFTEQDFKAGIGYQDNKFKTDFRYNLNHSKLGIPGSIGAHSLAKSPLLPYQNITNHVFSSKSTLFFNNSRLDINLGYIYNDRKEFEEEHHDDHGAEEEEEEDHDDHDDHEEDLEAALHMKLKTFNYDLKYNLPEFGKFETIVGIQGMNQINSNYGEEFLIPDAVTNDFGVFGTSHIHFNHADMQLGLRYDRRTLDVPNLLNKNYNSFNGALGVKTNITEKLVARLNLATGFRAPNLAELTSDGVHHGTNRYEIGNVNLNNEQNFQTDLAIEYKSDYLEFFVNGFYNLVNNYIYLLPTGDVINETPVYQYAQNDARLYGGEMGIHFHPYNVEWLHIESSFETVTGKQSNNNYLPLIPANSINNTVRVEFERPWLTQGYAFIKLATTFKQDNVSDFETPTAGYSLLSAGIGGNINLFNNETTIRISGTNLTNKSYFNHLSRLKSDGIYNMGRNISIGISYKF